MYWIGGIVGFIILIALAVLLLNKPAATTSVNTATAAKLTVWGTFDDSENMAPFISDFQKKFKNVQIEYSQKSVSTYEEDLLNALASGNGPDVFAIHNDWLPKYQDKLLPAPNTVFTPKSFKDTFVDVASTDFVSGSKIYAVPLSVDNLALYYNKDILGSAGIVAPAQTWDELKTQVKKITSRDGDTISRSGIALGTSTNINRAEDIVYLMMLQNKTVPYSTDNTQVTFDQGVADSSGNTVFPAADAVSFYTSFANANSDLYTWNNRSTDSVDAFANQEVGYMYGYSYLRDMLKAKSPNLNYDVALVPQPKAGENRVNLASYWGFGVSKQTKSPNTAWQFISSMSSKQSLMDYYVRHPLPAARKDLISGQIDTDLGIFATQNLTAKSFYKKDANKVDDIFTSLIDDITNRGQDINTALANASQKVQQLLSAQ